jgi:acyl-CoA thioesterase I
MRSSARSSERLRIFISMPRSTRSQPTSWVAVFAALLAVCAATRHAARADERVVVCLGDSLTEGYGLAPEESYPSLLERMLREHGDAVRVVNAGISGSTSASAASRLRWQLRSRPDVVVIELGANDGLRGLEVAATEANLSEAIALAKQSGARVLLAGMKLPPNYGPEYSAAFEAVFPKLAKQHGVALLPFLLEGVAANPELNQSDGIHPNARGTEIVARNVFGALQPLLAEAKARP